MRTPATIRQLRFELSAPNTPPAHQLPERLSRLHHDRLAAVLAEELSHYPPLQLAQLRVVVPPLALGRLEQDLPEALRTALRAALATLPVAPAPPAPATKPLALLAYFLLHGALPWHAAPSVFIPDDALRAALRRHPGALRELLRGLGSSEAVRQRLVRQLSEATLGGLIVLLEPIHAPFIKEYIAHTLATHHHQPWLAVPQAGLRVIVYELVLADLLLRWHTSFTRQAFLEKQIRELAAHYNLTYEALLQRLTAMLVGRQAPTTLTATLQVLQQRARPAAVPLAEEKASQRPSELPTLAGPAAYAALVQYLRAGFLPHHWQPHYSLVELSSLLAQLLREGRAAVQQLGRAVGPAAATALIQRFPLAISQQIVGLLAPGQARAFLALVAGLTEQTALPLAALPAYRQRLWQGALSYLLSAKGGLPSAVPMQQWLPRHSSAWAGLAAPDYAGTEVARAAAGRAPDVGPPGQATQQVFFTYLLQEGPTYLSGGTTHDGPQAGHLQALHRVLRQLLQQDAPSLLAFLRQHRQNASVLRQLAAITNFSSLVELVAQARATHPGYLAGQPAALATLLGEAAPATATTAQRWLREAYLRFHLRLHGQPQPSAARAVWDLLRGYNLPARAVNAWLLRWLAPPSQLARNPFFSWLLGNAPDARGEALLAEPGRENYFQPSTVLPPKASAAHPARATYLYPLATLYPAASPVAAFLFPTSEPGRISVDHRALPTQAQWEADTRRAQEFSSFAFFFGTGHLPAGRAGKGAGHSTSPAVMPRLKLSQTLAWRATSFQASSSWQLVGTRPAEAFELLLAHLLHGASIGPRARRRAMFKLALTQQSGALRAVLRRHGSAAAPMARRLAAIATFTELALLIPPAGYRASQQSAARRALAALDVLGGADATRAPAGLVFLKVAFMAFHTPAAGTAFSLRDAQRLAAVQQLPWQALLAQLTRLRQQLPGLAATAFFGRLWALTPTSRPGSRAVAPRQVAYARQQQRAVARRLATGSDAPFQVSDSGSELSGSELSGFESMDAPPAVAAQEALLYYLLHGQLPWWEPTMPSPAALRRTLTQTARQPLTQAFLQRHKLASPVQQRLASLADFSLLHTLTVPTGPGRQQRQLLRPAFARLDQLLRTQPGGSEARFHVFLREAYLAATLAGPSAGPQVGLLRKFATSAGLSWRSSLHRVGQLLRHVPALAADPFFALLLRQYQEATSPNRLPQRRGVAQRSNTIPSVMRPAPQRPLPPSPEAMTAAALATQLLEQYLRTGQLPTAYAGARAADLVQALLRAPDAGLRTRLLPYLERPVARHRLAAVVPAAPVFLPLLRWLAPEAHQALASIVRDWLRLQAAGLVQFGKNPTDLWMAVLALAHAKVPLAAPALAAALGQALVQGERALAPGPPAHSHAGGSPRSAAGPGSAAGKPVPEALRLLRLIQRSQVRLFSHLAALLAAQLTPADNLRPAPQALPPAPPLPARPLVRPKPLPPELQPDAATFIANAGLVLVWPFLTMLFERLGYVAEKQFVSIEQTTRAAYLLQFLATGEDQPPEHLLTLNKLLCGVGRTLPLVRELPLTDAEKATGESLLGAVMAQWGSAFKNTSLAGLRETFLQRGGKLAWADDKVTLTVETKTVDILLDQRPWSIALIKLPWMPLPLYVTWR